jgi:hypothetical protein
MGSEGLLWSSRGADNTGFRKGGEEEHRIEQ